MSSPTKESALELAARWGHERVVLIHDARTGLRAVVALHSSLFGPSAGGTRMRIYPRFDDAVIDALRLSRAMTYKATFAGVRFGGAKAVIDADPRRADRRELLEAYARAVVELEDRFVTGGDMGIDQDDVRFMAGISRAFAHAPQGAGPDASELTAIGLVSAIRATAARLGLTMNGLSVAIQGVGEVGGRVARRLAAEGARLTVADTLGERAHAVAAETGAELVTPEEIAGVVCDVFSPNAGGGGLDDHARDELRCRAICGAANNPLATDDVGEELDRLGILYAPDFVVNAGGILSLLFETGELDAAATVRRVERIGADLTELFAVAEAERIPPFRLAERRVEEILARKAAELGGVPAVAR